MKTPNTIEDEIDRIRVKIYEETKGMTPAQRAERTNRNSEAFVNRMGYKFVVINPQGHMKLVKIQPDPLLMHSTEELKATPSDAQYLN